MSAQLSVYADPQAEASGAVSAVVSSLPLSFAHAARPATGAAPAADVASVAGHRGWTERASTAIRNGAKGVVVSSPAAEDPTELAAAAAAAGAVLVLDQQWAGNAALAANGTAPGVLAAALNNAVLLDSVAIAAPGADPRQLLTEQLAILARCGIEVGSLRMVQRNGNGYTVAGSLASGAPLALQGILSSALAATASVSILTTTGRADVLLPDPAAAWPAEVRSVTLDGATTLPTLYESSHRTSWSRVHAHLSAGTQPDDLAHFSTVLSLLNHLNG